MKKVTREITLKLISGPYFLADNERKTSPEDIDKKDWGDSISDLVHLAIGANVKAEVLKIEDIEEES